MVYSHAGSQAHKLTTVEYAPFLLHAVAFALSLVFLLVGCRSSATLPDNDYCCAKENCVDFGAVVSGTGKVQRYFLLPDDVLKGDVSRVLTTCPCLQAKVYVINHRTFDGRIVELTVDSGGEISMPASVQFDVDLHLTSGKVSRFPVRILFLSALHLQEWPNLWSE